MEGFVFPVTDKYMLFLFTSTDLLDGIFHTHCFDTGTLCVFTEVLHCSLLLLFLGPHPPLHFEIWILQLGSAGVAPPTGVTLSQQKAGVGREPGVSESSWQSLWRSSPPGRGNTPAGGTAVPFPDSS